VPEVNVHQANCIE